MTSISKRPDGRWRARYRDADGKEHAKHFNLTVDEVPRQPDRAGFRTNRPLLAKRLLKQGAHSGAR